ncbi:MAG: hypothetical protein KDB88_07225 [Flavobacteriales bacterium]|nr:hypothetical protein [Flavobacteriales bacterium]
MRKTVLFAAALFAASAVSAQTGEITSNRGENWLSQDGDWGLTIDAWPFLNYFGNMFNGTQNNQPPSWSSYNTWDPYDWAGTSGRGSQVNPSPWDVTRATIGVKKLVNANTAYRGRIRLGFYSHKETSLVPDADPNASAGAMVEDVVKWGGNNIQIGVGLEKRVGSTRIVGVYGADFNVGIAGQKQTFEYGNALGEFETRTTEIKQGGAFMIGLNAFAGVEWFCAPKVSLGAEYAWGLMLASKGFNTTESESGSGVSDPINSMDSGTKVNDFGIDTNNNGVSINLNFYFQ